MKLLRTVIKILVAAIFGWAFWSVPATIGLLRQMSYKGGIGIWMGGIGTLATAAGLATGVRIFERKSDRGGFLSLFLWALSGVIAGYALGRANSPALTRCLNYMFALGTLSVVIRELFYVLRVKQQIRVRQG